MYKVIVFKTILSLSCTAALYAQDTTSFLHKALLYQSSWHALEDIIITQPQETTDALLGNGGLAALLAIAGGGGAYYLTQNVIESLNARPKNVTAPYPFLEEKRTALSGCTGILVSYITYNSVRSYFLSREKRKQVESIMDQWPEVARILPVETHHALQLLYDLKKQNSSEYTKQLDETVRLLKAAVYARFPQKYKKKEGDFFHQRNLHVNLNLNLYKIIKRVIKMF